MRARSADWKVARSVRAEVCRFFEEAGEKGSCGVGVRAVGRERVSRGSSSLSSSYAVGVAGWAGLGAKKENLDFVAEAGLGAGPTGVTMLRSLPEAETVVEVERSTDSMEGVDVLLNQLARPRPGMVWAGPLVPVRAGMEPKFSCFSGDPARGVVRSEYVMLVSMG